MKKYVFLIITMILMSLNLNSQNVFKAGTSALANYSTYGEKVNFLYGIDVAVEFGILKQWSVNVGAAAHYGSNENAWEVNRLAGNNQKDLLVGLESDIRYHFKEKYNGFYLGVGGDLKILNSKYFFPATENDPIPTLQDFEHSIGLTLGTYAPIGKLKLNPNLYIAGDPSSISEYPIHAKVGCNVVF